jgi:hypothetical protein
MAIFILTPYTTWWSTPDILYMDTGMLSEAENIPSRVFQLVVEDNKIFHDNIIMRHGPCFCTAHEISCSNNDMCHKFKNYNEHAKLRAWKIHRLNKEI